jgi:Mrp family chromosome partitioning ATPase
LDGRSATELLSAMTMRPVFRWFESQYHFTMVDTPPANTVADVGIIGQYCSGVMMVIRMHQTPEPLAKRAVRLLEVNNIPVLGCILIGRDERSGGYGYRYNRYHYYDYSAAPGGE